MVRRASWKLGLVVAVAAVLASVRPGGALSIIPIRWQGLVLEADIVAEVECTVAGGGVAKYRVVAIWKGPEKPGEEIRLRVPPDLWGNEFPLALVGQRFMVAAHRDDHDSRVRTTIGGGVPVLWRDLEAKYETPLLQGITPLEAGAETKACEIFGTTFASVEAFGQAAQALAREPAEVREKLRLDARMPGTAPIRTPRGDPDPAVEAALKAIAEARTVAEAQQALRKLGTPAAKQALQLVESFIRDRDNAGRPGVTNAATRPRKPPTPEEIQPALKVVPGPRDYHFAEAMDLLVMEAPTAAADFLLAWENPQRSRWDEELGYAMGSYFGYACPADRRKALLTRLLEAKDPDVRVAAAVYLAFEDLPAATAKLKEFAKLEGDAGAWAAITLARRGDAAALPRALEVFEGEGHNQSRAHCILQKQMLVLLSNSAAASGVVQPPVNVRTLEGGGNQKKGIDAWYARHGEKLKLVDAWAKELDKRQVD